MAPVGGLGAESLTTGRFLAQSILRPHLVQLPGGEWVSGCGEDRQMGGDDRKATEELLGEAGIQHTSGLGPSAQKGLPGWSSGGSELHTSLLSANL